MKKKKESNGKRLFLLITHRLWFYGMLNVVTELKFVKIFPNVGNKNKKIIELLSDYIKELRTDRKLKI